MFHKQEVLPVHICGVSNVMRKYYVMLWKYEVGNLLQLICREFLPWPIFCEFLIFFNCRCVRVVGGLGTVNVGHFSPKNIPDYILVTRARGKRL